MKTRHKTLLSWLAGTAAVAGLAWASDVVVLHPATISGAIAFTDPLSSFVIYEYSSQGGQPAQQSFTPAPASYSLTVEGGDATGLDYEPVIVASFQTSPSNAASLQITRNATVHVSYPGGNATGVDFTPTTVHLNASLTVTGGTLSTYYFSAYCNTPDAQYSAQTYGSPAAPATTSQSAWLAMAPCAQVNASAQAYVTDTDGNTTYHVLGAQTVDLSQGPSSVTWSLDLGNRGQLAGNIALTSPLAITSTQVIYNGVFGTDAYGISGNLSLPASPPTTQYAASYAVKLPAGDYDIYLRMYAQNEYSDTEPARITIAAQTPTTQDFGETLAAVHLPLTVSGFYNNASLSYAQMTYLRQDSPSISTQAGDVATNNAAFDFALSSGSWQPWYLYMALNDNTDPNLAVQSQMYKFFYSDTDRPLLNVVPGANLPLAAEQVSLVKSNLYFQVADGTTLISSPFITAFKTELNPDQSLKTQVQIYANGSSTPSALSGVTMVAEPGTYQLDAEATVSSTLTPFGGTSITFGTPVPTTGNQDVVLTSDQDPTLKVDVGFGAVSQPGISTMVQSLLGPAPPEGLEVACDPAENTDIGLPCPATYYDIKTTAVWNQPTQANPTPTATVCVRRRFPTDVFANAFTGYLHLWHFDETRPANDQWVQLPAPPPPAGTDCNADPFAFGCSDAFDCMDDVNQCDGCPGPDQFDADNNLLPQCFNTFKICGVTTSFSPFSVQVGTRMSNAELHGSPVGATGTLRTWNIRQDGTYHIVANGATGGHATTGTTKTGGCGAHVAGDFTLSQGDVLQVLIGQQGGSTAQSGGGAGGTFIAKNGVPLLVAGGGGGIRAGATVNGLDGSLTAAGGAGSSSADHTTGLIAGGAGGLGGKHLSGFGAGGGGWSGSGEADGTFGEGGFAFLAATTPGKGGAGKTCGALTDGGFGGGGSGNGCFGGGGGGGYSGGGGGKVGGGGGSWNAGANPTAAAKCTASGQGSFTITPLLHAATPQTPARPTRPGIAAPRPRRTTPAS